MMKLRVRKLAGLVAMSAVVMLSSGFSIKPVRLNSIQEEEAVTILKQEDNKEVPAKKEPEPEEAVTVIKEETNEDVATPQEEEATPEAVTIIQEEEVLSEGIETQPVNTLQEEAEVQAVTVAQPEEIKEHQVRASGYVEERVPGMMEAVSQLRTGSPYVHLDSTYDARYVLGAVLSDYCGIGQEYGLYYENKDGSYEIEETVWPVVYNSILQADADWAGYTGYVMQACSSLNLRCTDREMVNQINEYICANFDYLITNKASMPLFVSSKTGQCWHYAKLFADMCQCVGINCWKVETADHAWNVLTIDGVEYTFDCTYNDTSGNWTAYSWQQ